jgi:hypothetical protein
MSANSHTTYSPTQLKYLNQLYNQRRKRDEYIKKMYPDFDNMPHDIQITVLRDANKRVGLSGN